MLLVPDELPISNLLLEAQLPQALSGLNGAESGEVLTSRSLGAAMSLWSMQAWNWSSCIFCVEL